MKTPKSHIQIWLVLFLFSAPAHADGGIVGQGCVVDGDSIVVGGKLSASGWCKGGVMVRLFGADAPEWKQNCLDKAGAEWPCGRAAKDAMISLAGGKEMVCQVKDRDRYSRAVAVCMADGRDVGAEMVKRGLAVAYRRYSKRYIGEEKAAKDAAAGMWSGTFTMPEIWRRRNK